MRSLLVVASLLVSAPAGADDYAARLQDDQAKLEAAMRKKCPKRTATIAKTRPDASPAARCDALVALAECGRDLEVYHLKTSAACFAKNDFAQAEASARAALALRVTESAQLALLMALARTKAPTAKQRADLAEHLAYFEARPCSREDLCAGVAYVAWHADQDALTIRSSERAINQGFKGWQPYFFGGSVLFTRSGADRRKGREWLLEAKKRGGPSAIDDLLEAADGSR